MNPDRRPADPPHPSSAFHQNSAMFLPRVQVTEGDFQAQLREFYEQQAAAAHALRDNFKQMALSRQKELNQLQAQQYTAHKAAADAEKLTQLQHKSSDQQSAVASSEVKALLRNVIINKSHGNLQNVQPGPAAPSSSVASAVGPFGRNWNQAQHHSLDQHSPPNTGLSPSPPRPHPHIYTNNMRKASSEPNLKVYRPLHGAGGGGLAMEAPDSPVKQARGRPYARHHSLKSTRAHSPRTLRRLQAVSARALSGSSAGHSPTTPQPINLITSEPNIKVRLALKQKMMDRRSSPLLKRRDRHHALKQASSLSAGSAGLDPDSGPNTPPSSGATGPLGEGLPDSQALDLGLLGPGGLPLRLLGPRLLNQSLPNMTAAQRAALDAHLAAAAAAQDSRAATAAASLPVSAGTLPVGTGAGGVGGAGGPGTSAAAAADAEMRARLAALYGLPGAMPYYPMQMRGTEGEAALLAHMKMLAESMAESGVPLPYGLRPPTLPGLPRTHSAPLPLHQYNLLLLRQQEQLLRQAHPHYMRQKPGAPVLQSAMENVDEEAEARLAQEMREMREKEEEEEAFAMVQEMAASRHQYALHALQQKVSQRCRAQGEGRNYPGSLTASYPSISDSPPIPEHASTTAVAYDGRMLKHMCVCEDERVHEENPRRIEAIYARLHEAGILARCTSLPGRKATMEEIKLCHSEPYALLYGSNPKKLAESQINPKIFEHLLTKFCQLPCGGVGVDCDTTWHESYTPTAARVAVGAVVDLSLKVWSGEFQNGFAVVRPPGHHADPTQAMGFCYFNNVAIAAKQLLAPPRDVKRILILDWDVHHGNSTQQVFYADPRVLYISLHRHDDGNFFPGTGAPEECGIERGRGYNVNIAWTSQEGQPMSDAEYLAAFRCLVMPIAREFRPEIILVSAGFDGAAGHSPKLGGYEISPACFGYMTEELRSLAGGKLVLALEGGYALGAVCDCAEMCLRALLGERVTPPRQEELLRPPNPAAQATLSQVAAIQQQYWPCIARHVSTLSCSHAEASRRPLVIAPTDITAGSTSIAGGMASLKSPSITAQAGLGATPGGGAYKHPLQAVVAKRAGTDSACGDSGEDALSGSEPVTSAESALLRDTHNTCTQFASLSVVKESESEDKEDVDEDDGTEAMES